MSKQTFKSLAIGQSFDWINDERPDLTSFYARCTKTGPRTYEWTEWRQDHEVKLRSRVGCNTAYVFHVSEAGS